MEMHFYLDVSWNRWFALYWTGQPKIMKSKYEALSPLDKIGVDIICQSCSKVITVYSCYDVLLSYHTLIHVFIFTVEMSPKVSSRELRKLIRKWGQLATTGPSSPVNPDTVWEKKTKMTAQTSKCHHWWERRNCFRGCTSATWFAACWQSPQGFRPSIRFFLNFYME